MKVKESSIDLVLKLAQQSREHKVSWSDGFSIDKSILEFAQKKGVISHREGRLLVRKRKELKQIEENLIDSIEKLFKPGQPYTWVLSSQTKQDPVLFQESLSEGNKLISHKDEILSLLKENANLFNQHESLKNTLSEFSELTLPVYRWINQLFVGGTLEKEIHFYKIQKGGRQGKTRISRSLVANFLEPQIAEVVKKEGSLPSLSIAERQLIQFFFWKLDNLTEQEKSLKNLLLQGNKEDPKRDGYLIVFEQQEAIQTNYGNIQSAGYHHYELKEALKSLCEKQRRLVLKTKHEELRLSIPLLKKIDIEHKYVEDPEFKKYIAVYLDQNVVDLHLQYTSYPKNHFALLRNTPPQTRLNESEAAFFDFLYSEVSYDMFKSNTVKRKKAEFLNLLDTDLSFRKGKNLAKLADRIEQVLVPKAHNLGLLESFEIETNKENEEIYVFGIAARSRLRHLF